MVHGWAGSEECVYFLPISSTMITENRECKMRLHYMHYAFILGAHYYFDFHSISTVMSLISVEKIKQFVV